MRWRTLKEQPIQDILQFVKEAASRGQDVHVGTDSLQTGRYTQFCTVVIIHTPTKGGRVAYSREVVPRITSLRERLQKEVWKSVTVAMALAPLVLDRMSVHIDANTEPRFKSAQFAHELVGMVMGQGFRAVVKPNSYAASHAADWIVRHMGKFPGPEPQAVLKTAVA